MEKKRESAQLNEVYRLGKLIVHTYFALCCEITNIRLKTIVKELQHKEASIEAKRKAKQAKEQNVQLQVKRLGKLQYLLLHNIYIKIYVNIICMYVCMYVCIFNFLNAMYVRSLFLTNIRYVEPDIDVQLSEEITGSLRTLKVHIKVSSCLYLRGGY